MTSTPWFVRSLAQEGSAFEIEPGVVREVIGPDADDPGLAEQVDIVHRGSGGLRDPRSRDDA